jgi:hypothetical protein
MTLISSWTHNGRVLSWGIRWGKYGALVQNFRSLDEGIEFTMDNPWHRVPGADEPYNWSLAEVENLGPRCPAGGDIRYPVPVRNGS